MITRLRALHGDQEGVTIVEFALIAPALMVLLLGIFDLGYNMYTNQMVQGAIQRAARASTIEGAASNKAGLDGIVTNEVHAVAGNAVLTFERKSYASFSRVGRPEDYTDANANSVCDNGEPFEDANGNGLWDTDPGSAGFGGARDAVLYTVTVKYPRLVPIGAFLPGQNKDFTLKSSTVLRNQPYGAQGSSAAAPPVLNCK
ncbi:TadE/TadG family type IV pilus assembly protein [Novosphingobium sp.]|uniref:TadE/TadG family type IV pilus assembly protein n=1 Tax=Novosphingobium sp. TaxID=1874826 RepID=UPI0025F73091|nr:TadE family protein [Novosphingobium sp.]